MNPERWARIDELFQLALEREASDRAAFLAQACGDDVSLRLQVESLLAADGKADTFLEGIAGPRPTLAAGQRLGPYEIVALLGSGGMGEVYRATDIRLGRAVAIKVLSAHFSRDQAAKARFIREARSASALDHPNIAVVYDIGDEGGELYIVMALYEGETLKQRLRKGALDAGEALGILRQVALGLEMAHCAGIVHRDIKPANILLTNSGLIKILDFGLAKLASEAAGDITGTGFAIGTLMYMSPEQLSGQAVDRRSDLWSFGALAYELLAGIPPFKADSNAATAARILHEEPPSLAAVPGIPDWLAGLVSQLLRKNPDERPESASEALRRLEAKIPSSTTETHRGSTRPRTGSKRGWRSWAALAFVASLILATAAWWGLRTRTSNQGESADRSIAVLPFPSLSVGEENAYFAQGFHDELLRQIGRIGDLRVISRTSVLQYKDGARNLREIAGALGVSSVLEGSVQRSGDRIRVEARLVDARNDRQIWGDRYDRNVTDVFAIQTAVAEEIAGALRARLSQAQKAQIERRPTESAEAYDLYLRALEYANRPGNRPDNLAIAERLYQKAIQTDPSFALALARLAFMKLQTYWSVASTPDQVVEEARKNAEESLRLQPDLPEGHYALGFYYYWGPNDYDRALKEFEIARSGMPAEAMNAIGYVFRRKGRFDEAIRNQEEALRLDPRSPNALFEFANSLLWTRRYEEADRALDRVLTIAPDFAAASPVKALVQEAWKGETARAKEVLLETRDSLDRHGNFGGNWVLPLLGHHPREALLVLASIDSATITDNASVYPKAFLSAVANEALGNVEQARKEFAEALPLQEVEVEKHPARAWERSYVARSYAGLGRKEDALREARRAVEILPMSKDALIGPAVEIERAAVEARVGETEAAIEHIRQLLAVPCLLSPGLLRIDPRWAPLRGDPRFRKLAEIERD